PRGDDGGPEGAGRRGRLDPVVHHDAPQPALRRVRPVAVPPPEGGRLREDRQASRDLVPERPGADRGPRSLGGRRRDADGVHAPQVPPGGRPVPRRGDDPPGDRVRPDEPVGRSRGDVRRCAGRRRTVDRERARGEETRGARQVRGGRGADPGDRVARPGRGRSRHQPRDPDPPELLHRPRPRDRDRHECPVGRPGRLRRPAGFAAGRLPAREVWTGRGTRSGDQADPHHPDARLGAVARGRGGRAARDPESGDREKLEQAKAEVYKSGFYRGVLNENCGPFAGVRVEIAKEEIRKELTSKGQADLMYEPSAPVVCRCMTPAIVKVVDNQWFLAYGDPAWKAQVHEAIASMELHPEALRKWFDYVTDWLHDWPCTHHRGLGTILPWDSNWVIESLSDSTIYMAYYTIAHALQGGAPRS